jgi:cell wall-associated NlpC family hydrolase
MTRRTASTFFRTWLPLLAVLVLFQACAPGRRLTRDEKKVEAKLKEALAEWQGTPYKLGGQSKKGVDCSGFIQLVFKEQFDVKLPRTTDQQIKHGKAVKKNKDLKPGDVVFFRTGKKQLHAGIVVRGKTFIHASTSKGVRADQLDNSYWKKVYLKARRYL